MLVHVRVEGDVEWYHHLKAFHLVIEKGTALERFLVMIGVSHPNGIVMVNGQLAPPDRELTDGDEIVIQKRGDGNGSVSE